MEGGVTIDLSLLNWTRFDEASELVDLGPGGRWRQVYAELHKQRPKQLHDLHELIHLVYYTKLNNLHQSVSD
ncbi:hypothetical protein V1506DRAFT_563264 [Lipomyces tetrasporus]